MGALRYYLQEDCIEPPLEERRVQEGPNCQSNHIIKSGTAAGKPKKQCKQCGSQFTRTTPRGKPVTTKINTAL